MRQVYINDIDVFNEYGMYLKSRNLGVPVPNTYSVQVPGMNGVLDYTPFFGELTYQNRNISFSVKRFYDVSTSPYMIKELERRLNGKKAKVIFSDDFDHYWEGRIFVNSDTDNEKIQEVSFVLDAHPFKRRVIDDSEVRDDV